MAAPPWPVTDPVDPRLVEIDRQALEEEMERLILDTGHPTTDERAGGNRNRREQPTFLNVPPLPELPPAPDMDVDLDDPAAIEQLLGAPANVTTMESNVHPEASETPSQPTTQTAPHQSEIEPGADAQTQTGVNNAPSFTQEEFLNILTDALDRTERFSIDDDNPIDYTLDGRRNLFDAAGEGAEPFAPTQTTYGTSVEGGANDVVADDDHRSHSNLDHRGNVDNPMSDAPNAADLVEPSHGKLCGNHQLENIGEEEAFLTSSVPAPEEAGIQEHTEHQPLFANSTQSTDVDMAEEEPATRDPTLPEPYASCPRCIEVEALGRFVVWVALEATRRGLMGSKTYWSKKEVEKVFETHVEWKMKNEPGYTWGSTTEPLTPAQLVEAEEVLRAKERKVQQLLRENWMKYFKPATTQIARRLEEHGMTRQEIKEIVTPRGQPDLFGMVGKLWHLNNPTAEPPKIEYRVACRDGVGGWMILPLCLREDASYMEFMQSLNEYDEYPDERPEWVDPEKMVLSMPPTIEVNGEWIPDPDWDPEAEKQDGPPSTFHSDSEMVEYLRSIDDPDLIHAHKQLGIPYETTEMVRLREEKETQQRKEQKVPWHWNYCRPSKDLIKNILGEEDVCKGGATLPEIRSAKITEFGYDEIRSLAKAMNHKGEYLLIIHSYWMEKLKWEKDIWAKKYQDKALIDTIWPGVPLEPILQKYDELMSNQADAVGKDNKEAEVGEEKEVEQDKELEQEKGLEGGFYNWDAILDHGTAEDAMEEEEEEQQQQPLPITPLTEFDQYGDQIAGKGNQNQKLVSSATGDDHDDDNDDDDVSMGDLSVSFE